MSIKTIAVLDESELKDGQMYIACIGVDRDCQADCYLNVLSRKEIAFEESGKVLLSRLGDKVHATSAFCTHYGAPLAKGVLTSDGRVVWWV